MFSSCNQRTEEEGKCEAMNPAVDACCISSGKRLGLKMVPKQTLSNFPRWGGKKEEDELEAKERLVRLNDF